MKTKEGRRILAGIGSNQSSHFSLRGDRSKRSSKRGQFFSSKKFADTKQHIWIKLTYKINKVFSNKKK